MSADILSVAVNVLGVVGLKRDGGEHVGPCPVCGGRDRFAINRVKGLWNCRGCGKGGDAIGLVMHVRSSSYREAVALIGEEGRRRPSTRAKGVDAAAATKGVQPALWASGEAERRRKLLLKRRRHFIGFVASFERMGATHLARTVAEALLDIERVLAGGEPLPKLDWADVWAARMRREPPA